MYLGRVVLTPDDIRYSLPENRRYTPSEGNQEKRVLSVNGKDFSWHTEMYVALRGIAAHIHTNTKTTGTVTENTRGHVAELTK